MSDKKHLRGGKKETTSTRGERTVTGKEQISREERRGEEKESGKGIKL